MYDWEQNYGRNTTLKDDPWDLTPAERRKKRAKLRSRKAESHDPTPDHKIGSCDADVTFSSASLKQKKSGNAVKIVAGVLVAVSVLFSALTTIMSSIFDEGEFVIQVGSESIVDTDPFEEDVDPDFGFEPDDGVDIWDQETGPSEVERYDGASDFALTLKPSDGMTPLTYQEIYAKVLPSVVTITVYNDYSGAYATGIILSEDGYILTNQHVVACQTNAQVTTANNVTYDALLVGEDPNSDLALLKIDAVGLTPAEFASSDDILVGDECFAIGNPLGINYRASFTNGIISAVSRNVNMNDYTMDLIQTNTALNSGNSGGPLINIYGQVIGINNMKIMSTESTIEGMGFAIPTTTAQKVIRQIIDFGEVEHPVIGITCYAVTAGDMDGNEIDGVFVYTISPDCDAAAQGMQAGDIITHINGQRIYQVDDVDLSTFRVGDRITVTVWRDGETFDITFALVEQNDLS